jgi:hypothetical protein
MDATGQHLLKRPLPHRRLLSLGLDRRPVAILRHEQVGAEVERFGELDLIAEAEKHGPDALFEVDAGQGVNIGAEVGQPPSVSLDGKSQGHGDHVA